VAARNGGSKVEKPTEKQGFVVNLDGLPPLFPTHRHSASFWEHLGRAVATFGHLEEVLGKAIFALTGTVRYDESEIQIAFEKWVPTLERALSDPLGNLIDVYGKAYRNHPEATFKNFDDLLAELRRASEIRNVLCHGSWRIPDANGRSLPLFVNRRQEVFCTPIDVDYLQQTQRAVAKLIGNVVSSITAMGWQFPGTRGPGAVIYQGTHSDDASNSGGQDHLP
jgi:hypothetical protein